MKYPNPECDNTADPHTSRAEGWYFLLDRSNVLIIDCEGCCGFGHDAMGKTKTSDRTRDAPSQEDYFDWDRPALIISHVFTVPFHRQGGAMAFAVTISAIAAKRKGAEQILESVNLTVPAQVTEWERKLPRQVDHLKVEFPA